MSKKTDVVQDELIDKLNYIGLNLEKLPKSITEFKDLEYRVPKFYDETKHKQYKYIDIKDIQILLSPTNRMEELEDKYKKASPLVEYLDSKDEKNLLKHTTFLKMLKDVKIEDIEQIQKEQEKLNKNIPFKVRFTSNYLWQIYYSKNTDKYFMIVPTEDTQYAPFFYVLKKKLERGKSGKIFVPICCSEYSTTYLKRTEYQDMENYLWLFTKDWPIVYEVYDKENNMSIQIVGETQVYEKIKSIYKIKLESKEQANSFYKLIKAMFILQTELPNYFKFRTDINNEGGLNFYIENREIEYKDLPKWLKEEYLICEYKKEQERGLIKENKEKLNKLKEQSVMLEMEYVEKEKQISTFLECRKTFFGRVKYYFKYSKGKKNKKSEEKIKMSDESEELELEKEENDNDSNSSNINNNDKANYTIEDIMDNYKEYEKEENSLKDVIMDINALKLKNKNLEKKIENATTYIQEIDSHKKSIFDFWKYSNKDEMATLPEGEQEEINVVKKIVKAFDYEDDIELFGKKFDRILRRELNQDETDAIFISTTRIIDILNKIKTNVLLPKDIENNLKEMKKEAIEEKTLFEDDEFDIFGGIVEDSTKVKKINNKKHRELPKDKFKILEISKSSKQIGYKLLLEKIIGSIKRALDKIEIDEEMPIYKAIDGTKLKKEEFNVFNINPENEIKEVIDNKVEGDSKNSKKTEINLYKINLGSKINAIPYTNIIFYDNQNQTLPVGMDLSTKILVDTEKIELKNLTKTTFSILTFENKDDEFSNINIKKINVEEYEQ